MDHLSKLPEGCLSEILSRTSPLDVGRSAATSKGFMYASESDIVWERFLPSDYEEIISRSSSSSVDCGTKKELYFKLSDSFVLLDRGKLSFALDKRSGKKCFMIAARQLNIAWGDHHIYWEWISHRNSRFSEVATLRSVCWLDIRGCISSHLLSPNTVYAAYLVFGSEGGHYGLEHAEAYVRFVDHECKNEAENRASHVHLAWRSDRLHQAIPLYGKLPQSRPDGWLEVEMESFYNGYGDVGEVEARLIEIKRLNSKSGLIVEGIEFRPKGGGENNNP